MDEKSTTYSSTRGGQASLSFREVVMTGLAHDGGLFVPDVLPQVTTEELNAWKSLCYKDLAVEVIRKFVKDDQVPLSKLKDIVGRSCDAFRAPEVTPVVEVGGHAILVSTRSGLLYLHEVQTQFSYLYLVSRNSSTDQHLPSRTSLCKC